jgi:cell division protein FtsB
VKQRKPNKKEQSFIRRNLRTILGLAVLALAIHDLLGPHGFLAMRRTQQEIAQLNAEMQKLNNDNQALSDEVNALKTDPRLIERIAREDMGLARPGEIIVKIPPPPDKGKTPQQKPR